MTRKRLWTKKENQILRSLYTTTPNNELSGILGRSEGAIRNRANKYHLKKSAVMKFVGRDPYHIILERQRQAGFI